MIPLLLPGIMSGLGALKGGLDMVREGKQRKLQANTTMWSPWTGMKADAPTPGDPFGGALQGFTGGMMLQNANPKMFGAGGGDSVNLWDSLGQDPNAGVPSAQNFNPQFQHFNR